ncbi:hypothetical protein [Bradyrhizobium sp.]|uniref:hypothetical protein n=1 Tax=Bradyrhizobium sp. TaxID=376 RepID=UPI001EB16786|nr:hypothetical protein [Bradyrhizobium sp.]MBV9984491.1 hypothetical protein [Bradyrhizobium sp.]
MTTISLGAALPGFRTFASASIPDGTTVSIAISDTGGSPAQSLVGRGIYSASANTITITTILASTNAGAMIPLSGSAQIAISPVTLDFLSPYNYRQVTAVGDVTVGASDLVILLNKIVPAPTNIILPAAASRQGGFPVTVKDYSGNAQANNIRFVLAAGETIDGFSQSTADANGASKITTNNGKKILYPLLSGGWYL